jgi:hypothetical protein
LKQPGPNSFQQELARTQRADSHPEADMLTAFSEGSLLERERKDVMAHLSVCAYCRDVISLAASAAFDPSQGAKLSAVSRPSRLPLRNWLPWVAAAACIFVVSAAVLVHQLERPASTGVEVAGRATNNPTQPAPVADKLSQISRSPEAKAERKKSGHSAAITATPPAGRSASANGALAISSGAQISPQADAEREGSRQAAEAAAESAPIPAGSAPVPTPAQPASAPVPAMPESATAPSAAPTARVMNDIRSAFGTRARWRINDQGQLQRSLNGGEWQPALIDEKAKMRVVSVLNGEVWVGGENMRLYRSVDNGGSWNPIPLPEKDSGLHVITQIHFQTGHAVTVEAEDGTSWSSSDDGKTWK